MKSVYILLNEIEEFDFSNEIRKYLPDWKVSLGTEFPLHPDDYFLIVPWGYRKVIKEIPVKNNVVVFHSSDLPKGRGWAPIYHAIADENEFYVITAILISEKVDCGDIIAKVRFRILPEYLAKDLRRFDVIISLMLIEEIYTNYNGKTLSGVPQAGSSSYNKKRSAKDNEIDISKSFRSLIPHLRACENNSKAYFFYNGCRYTIRIEAETMSEFPSDLQIDFL